MTKTEMFRTFIVTELDVTIDNVTIKKPKHVSVIDWLQTWQDPVAAFNEGYEKAKRHYR